MSGDSPKLGVLFTRGIGVLPLLAHLDDSSSVERPRMYVHDDGSWWVEADLPHGRLTTGAAFATLSGGTAFCNPNGRWFTTTPTGERGEPCDCPPSVDRVGWRSAKLADLFAILELRSRPIRTASCVHVLTPVALGRYVLRRSLQMKLQVHVQMVEVGDLTGSVPPAGAVLLRLTAPERHVPASFLHSLAELPHTLPCLGGDDRHRMPSILVDMRYQSPAPPQWLLPWISPGDTWVLSSGEGGHRRVTPRGTEVDGASFLEPIVSGPPAPPKVGPPRWPEPVPIRVIRSRVQATPDAVLVDDHELRLATRYLQARPVGELTFILPGPGQHLLVAPGGLADELPIGRAVVRIGPSALYLEQGWDFSPPLPDGARIERWQLDSDQVVVLLGPDEFAPGAAPTGLRLSLEHLLPAWSLWVGECPSLLSGADGQAIRLFERLESGLRRLTGGGVMRSEAIRLLRPDGKRVRRAKLLRDAQEAELRGDLLQAAELLEEAGESARAGRLYQQVADE